MATHLMQTTKLSLAKMVRQEWFWLLLGLTLVLFQAVGFAYMVDPMLDEGTYAYKGYQFLSGKFEPYQEHGFWTNKMPLSFLIPGGAQWLFGPGLRASRYYALILFFLMLAGIWWITRRVSGKWVAAGLLFFIAANRFFLSLYSLGVSQGLIACMLIWALAFTLGKERPRWQIILGGVLAGLIPMTRENMAPFVAFLGIYLIWEHGLRKSWPALAASALTIGLVHAVYWPEILRNWAAWMPDWFPLLASFQVQVPGATSASALSPGLFERFFAFCHAVFLQMPLWVGSALAWLLWPRKSEEGVEKIFKPMLFLSLLFLALIGLHGYASLGGNYCIQCFENYMGFYAPLGWLLVGFSFPFWMRRLPAWRHVLAAAALLFLGIAWGLGSAHETAAYLLDLRVPRTRDMRILPGMTDLWRSLSNKFGWTYEFQRYLLPALAGLGVCALLLLFIYLAAALRKKEKPRYAPFVVSGVLLAAAALGVSLGLQLDRAANLDPCQKNVIAAHERVGAHLVQMIPPGAWVYWEGAPTVDLLYLPEVNVFPPQLNQRFSFYTGGNPDTLSRYGLWNQALADAWLKEADYLVVDEGSGSARVIEEALALGYLELPSTPPYYPCRAGTRLRLFERKH